jgi:hypothetical protein
MPGIHTIIGFPFDFFLAPQRYLSFMQRFFFPMACPSHGISARFAGVAPVNLKAEERFGGGVL